MKRLIALMLLFTCFSYAAENKKIDRQCTSVSTTPLSFTNDVGGMTASFEEVITGAPASSSIVINGCKNGTNCTVLETYTGNTTSIRAPAVDKIYDYFTVVPTWSGGTSPSVCVYYTVTIGRNGGGGSGGAVTSVAGKTGIVTLVEADVTSLPSDLTARELIANKDTDVTLAANSDVKYPSQKAIKAYVASQLGGGFYQTIQSNGTPVTQRAATNYSSEFSAVDNVTKTDVSIVAITQTKVTGLGAALAAKSDVGHPHVESDVSSLVGDLASKLPLAGGTLVGAVTFAGGQTFPGTAATSHTHAAADIVSGTIVTARLASGTASANTMLCGNQTWCTTLPTAMMPDLAGDLNGANGSLSVNVIGINGVLLSGLTTGIYKFTAGVPSTAVAADFPTLNQSTSGNAASATVLAGTPTQCSGTNFSTGISANGNSNCSTPSGSNPLTLLGDIYVGGVSGAPTALHPPTTPSGVTYFLTSTPDVSGATQAAYGVAGVPVRSVGTTPVVIAASDRTSIVIPTNSTTSTAVTIAAVGSTGFDHNFTYATCNMGTVVATYTPATSHVNGNTTVKLQGVVAGNNPSCAFWWSDSSDYYSGVILPTDGNGRLQAAGFPAVSGDVTISAGTLTATVTKINGTTLSSLGTGILKNTTVTGVPSIAVAADFPTLNQNTTGNAATATAFATVPTQGTTSQLCRGIDDHGNCTALSILPTAMVPAWIGDVTGAGATLTITVTKINGTSLAGLATGILKNTTTTGIPSIAAFADVANLFSGTCNSTTFLRADGQCQTPVGSGTVNAGTATHFGYYATSSSAISDAGPDLAFDGTHTFTLGSPGILDLSAGVVNMPGSAGFVPTADKRFGINTTNHTFVHGSNGTTLVGAVAATGTGIATTCSSQVITAISGIAVPTCTSIAAGWLPTALSSSTSINGLSITASTGTVTVTNGKTLIISNSMTLSGTDGVSVNLDNVVLATTAATAAGQVPYSASNNKSLSYASLSPSSLTDGSTITWAIGSVPLANATVTIGGNRTLNITGPLTGGNYVLRLVQDGTGSRTLALGTGCTWKVSGGGGAAITPSTAANAIDILAFYYDGTICYANFNKNFN